MHGIDSLVQMVIDFLSKYWGLVLILFGVIACLVIIALITIARSISKSFDESSLTRKKFR